jgi:4-amino-4-deoxy-L-arabinose transferase-like glycosyltransferase
LRRSTILLSLFALALVLRILWLAYAQPQPWSDYEDYRSMAASLLDHQQLGYPEPSARRLPGLPAFLALMMLFSRSLTWLSLSQVLVSSAIVVAVAELTRRLTGGDVRLMAAAGLATAINPSLIAYAPVLASEHLFALLTLCALLMAVGSERPTPGRAALTGVLAGAAVLTRGESLFYVPLLALLLLLPAQPRMRRATLLAAFAAVCAVIVAPWYVRNLRVLGPGAGLSTNSGLIFYYAHNEEKYGRPNRRGTPLEGLSDVEAQRRGFELGMAYLREDPTRLLRDVATGTRRLFWPNDYAVDANVRSTKTTGEDEWPERELAGRAVFTQAVRAFYMLTIVLAPLAVLAFRAYPLKTWLVAIGVPVLNWVCYAVIFMAAARYRYITDIVLSALAGAVVVSLWQRWQAVRRSAVKGRPAPLPL